MFARSRSGARGVTLALVGLLTATTLAPLPTLAQDAETLTEVSGYYDQNGVWVEETSAASTGYVDEYGNWVDTSGQAAPVAESTGYVDESGTWVDTTVESAPAAESTGYVDASGNWVDTTAEAAPAVESTGYVDASGNWVDTTGQATAVAPVSGYYDANGNWVEGAVDPATQTQPVAQDNGYYDQNGVWVDNSASAADNVIYNTSAGTSNTTSAPAAAPIGTAYIAGTNGDGAICRTGADWNTPELGTIPEGSAVEVTGGTVGEWQPVNCNGSSGYVHASFISWDQNVATVDAASDTTVVEAQRRNRNNRRGDNTNNNAGTTASGNGQSLVNFASGYLGYPYVYAGAGPSGFDCSGFTMYVVQNTLGINIGHGVAGQYSAGTPVSKNSLQPGDLVFFENTFAPGLSHVGIYIGNGQFIHSENESTGVVISDLNSDYYASHYYGAVRLA